MGNFRFRFSDIIPNAWFYKLKDMGKTRNNSIPTNKNPQIESSSTPKHQTHFRKSYYFSRELVSPPRKSSRRLRSRRFSAPAAARASPKIVISSVSAGFSCRSKVEPPVPECSSASCSPEFRTDRILTPDSFDDMINWSRSDDTKDIVIDVERIELPPIITKPEKFDDSVKGLKKKDDENETIKFRRNFVRKEEIKAKEQRKSSSRSAGMKLRINNSPRIGSRKIIQAGRKSAGYGKRLSESLAVVKSSFDPQRDFRESMVEMIVENNMRESKDLEDLLACYLTLNSVEYHDLIIKVFKQIWFELSNHARIK